MLGSLPLFELPRAHFNGADYVPARDDARLTGQIQRVFDLMSDGGWRTLDQITAATGDPQASVSAQLRHLRKERFGSHGVTKRHRGEPANGLYEYRLTVRSSPASPRGESEVRG